MGRVECGHGADLRSVNCRAPIALAAQVYSLRHTQRSAFRLKLPITRFYWQKCANDCAKGEPQRIRV
jgi:hypothetical protein